MRKQEQWKRCYVLVFDKKLEKVAHLNDELTIVCEAPAAAARFAEFESFSAVLSSGGMPELPFMH